MLAGRLPFEGESALDVIGSILNKEPAPLGETPRELRRIVEKCLRKDREIVSHSRPLNCWLWIAGDHATVTVKTVSLPKPLMPDNVLRRF